jgi:hypothetical protein
MTKERETMTEEYEVGRGKPPIHSRWKKGCSGNPRGRPPKPPLDTLSVVELLDGDVQVRQGGVVRTMSTFEVGVRKMVGKALGGDVRAALRFLKLCDRYDVIVPGPERQTSGVLDVPPDWDFDEWVAMFKTHGPPPWRGKRSGRTKEEEKRWRGRR